MNSGTDFNNEIMEGGLKIQQSAVAGAAREPMHFNNAALEGQSISGHLIMPAVTNRPQVQMFNQKDIFENEHVEVIQSIPAAFQNYSLQKHQKSDMSTNLQNPTE